MNNWAKTQLSSTTNVCQKSFDLIRKENSVQYDTFYICVFKLLNTNGWG